VHPGSPTASKVDLDVDATSQGSNDALEENALEQDGLQQLEQHLTTVAKAEAQKVIQSENLPETEPTQSFPESLIREITAFSTRS
jgi:hypothetical protein